MYLYNDMRIRLFCMWRHLAGMITGISLSSASLPHSAVDVSGITDWTTLGADNMEDESQDLCVLFSKPITYSSWGEEKQKPPSCESFFWFFLFLLSSDAPPTRKRGKSKGSMEKKTAAQFRLWGQLAAKVSSGKDNRARIESCCWTSPCAGNLKLGCLKLYIPPWSLEIRQ